MSRCGMPRRRENIYRTVIKTAGSVLLRDVTTATIRGGRERRAQRPHAANNFLEAMRGFFGWAADIGLVRTDPTGKMAQHYTRAADRMRLARDAAELLLPEYNPRTKTPAPRGSGAGRGAKARVKSSG
jgi:site-specific recombinase XerD